MSNEIRSAVYLVTMLKDCLIKREIIGKELQNFEDKKKQITAALPKMKVAEANQYKQVLASLDKHSPFQNRHRQSGSRIPFHAPVLQTDGGKYPEGAAIPL